MATTLRTLLAAIRKTLARYEILGGLPGGARIAWASGHWLEAEPGECKAAFEARAFKASTGRLVIFGGLPPFPGTMTILTPDPQPPAPSYWSEEDEGPGVEDPDLDPQLALDLEPPPAS
jgi:hypothetical protein